MTKPLDPKLIPKYVNQLVVPPVFKPFVVRDPSTGEVLSHNYTIFTTGFKQQLLPPDFPETLVWGYEGIIEDGSCFSATPGPTFEAVKEIPVNVQWVNNLTDPHFLPVDPTLHWANPNNMPTPEPPFQSFPPGYPLAQCPVPVSTHLHGGEVRSDSDGGPESWFTAGEEKTGPNFTQSRFTYPNQQEPSTLWYHDHTLGITRLNVVAGLSGFYLLRDPNNDIEPLLPSGPFEIPIVIQDRSFNEDGSLLFPNIGVNPEVHPYWVNDFLGNSIMVNGKVWPNLDVERRQYRIRFLNGSNSRFFNLKLSNDQSFIQIGSDGGFLRCPVTLTELLIAPAERADVLIDFSKVRPGTKIIVTNDAFAPFPGGDRPDPDTTGQIMQFTVLDTPPVRPVRLPPILNNIPILIPDVPKQTFTLNVVREETEPGPRELLLDGQRWESPISEMPQVGSTVDWVLANVSAATHPIHVHLVQFQMVSRQLFDSVRYLADWESLNGKPPLQHPTIPLDVEPYLIGKPMEPDLNEQGWKDTFRANPNEVTILRLRFAPQNIESGGSKPGVNQFSFDPTIGPGYVWHCHILDHEDNDMMRPMKVVSGLILESNPQSCCEVVVEGNTQLVPPALNNAPISDSKTVFAEIEKVCPEKVIISGFLRKSITYTAVLDNGVKEDNTITDDLPFQCIIDREDANENDSFMVTGSTVLCEVFANTQNFGAHPETNDEVAYNFIEKDIIKVCIRKNQ
ncbi:multicopper oxidase domain-containing protein [Chengkuizengella sediminis]|uniref:multicopper oxidase domain-containing protein n=1 Tax=Chengkuizengella sediminis TaxID=1885917 RepID=UPI001389A6C0|nr:multicopper oxidase domain-containing protein [Chengkuizengella sediminis]NDI33269.1 multicopper oxidase domain-containing protein [Chengkuizengella sediminis]